MINICAYLFVTFIFILLTIINTSKTNNTIRNLNINQYELLTYLAANSTLFRVKCKRNLYDSSTLQNIIIQNNVYFSEGLYDESNSSCYFIPNKQSYFSSNIIYNNSKDNVIILFWMYLEKYNKNSTILQVKMNSYYISTLKIGFSNVEDDYFIDIDFIYYNNKELHLSKNVNGLLEVNKWTFVEFVWYNQHITLYFNAVKTGHDLNLNNDRDIVTFDSLDILVGKGENNNYFEGRIYDFSLMLLSPGLGNKLDEVLYYIYKYKLCEYNEVLINDTVCMPCDYYLPGCTFCPVFLQNSTIPNYCYYCDKNHFLNTTTQKCQCKYKHCLECDSTGCLKCEVTYEVDSKKNCELKSCKHLEHCKRCDGDKCYECEEDYIIYGDECRYPYRAFTGVVCVYCIIVFFIWIFILGAIRPRLIK